MPVENPRLCLPVEAWPAADRAAWLSGMASEGLFEDGGPGALWSAASRRKTASGYGRWLRWLLTSGQCDRALAAGERVTPERGAAYVAALEAIYPGRRVEAALLYTHTPQLFVIPDAVIAAHKPALQAPQETFTP